MIMVSSGCHILFLPSPYLTPTYTQTRTRTTHILARSNGEIRTFNRMALRSWTPSDTFTKALRFLPSANSCLP
jgi:hypothetical protein